MIYMTISELTNVFFSYPMVNRINNHGILRSIIFVNDILWVIECRFDRVQADNMLSCLKASSNALVAALTASFLPPRLFHFL